MVTTECSGFVKLFLKSRHEEMKQSGLGVHTVLQTLLIDKNKVFCQLGQSYSKVRDWGQDTRVIVGVMGSPITQLIQTYDLSVKIQRYTKKNGSMQDPTPSGRTTVNSQTLLDPKMVHRLHWHHVLDKPPFWAGHDLVFAQGIDTDLCEPLCSKDGELKKKTILKWCV